MSTLKVGSLLFIIIFSPFLNAHEFNPAHLVIDEISDQVLSDYLTLNKENAVNQYINNVKSEYRIIINPNLKY